MKDRWILGVVCISAGLLVGIGGYTFWYAKGFSYFSADPRACTNCHVMQEHYDSWIKASHHAIADCNDCHVPHTFPEKFIVKGRNGWNHSKAFTLQNFPEPIRITKENLETLQHSCIDCHKGMVSEIVGHEDVGQGTARCTECHRSVGHMSLD